MGSKGIDYLDGSKGNDILEGGLGSDVFQISKGFDRVTDFNLIQGDRIALSKTKAPIISIHDDGVLISSGKKKQLLLEEMEYSQMIEISSELFVRIV